MNFNPIIQIGFLIDWNKVLRTNIPIDVINSSILQLGLEVSSVNFEI